ncbi:MAG: head GIN domain-containing protein [Oscillospiraceae bacterium]|jgi:hypothetical protein
MKKIITILLCTLFLLSCLGCSVNGLRVKQLNEKMRTETMQSDDPCQKIVIEGLFFTSGKPCTVTVENGPSVSVEADLPTALYDDYGFTMALQNGILTLSAERQYRFRLKEAASIHITAPLDALEVAGGLDLSVDATGVENFHLLLEGAGDVSIENLDTDMAEVAIAGAGDVTLTGKTAAFSCGITGAGDINAEHLLSSTADLSITGAGDITLAVQDALRVKISGAGSVSYYGSPEIQKSVAGAGDVAQKSAQIPSR